MRKVVDRERIERLMVALGSEATAETRIYFTGGATALLLGWRARTIDVDLKIVPERDELFRAIQRLKEQLRMNIELASPADFIPESPDWEKKSVFISRHGQVSFYHYDLYAQALAKIERGHRRDMEDVREMLARGLIDREGLVRRFEEIEPWLYRFPAIDPASFRRAVEDLAESPG